MHTHNKRVLTAPATPARAGGITRYLLARKILHPWAWWIWALGIAGATSLTTNPYVLALALCVICFVVMARRDSSPWARAFPVYLMLAGALIVYRLIMHILVGSKVGTTKLFAIPTVELPRWAAGINLFGTVYAEGLLQALTQGLVLGCMIVAIGAANSLSHPKALVKALPGALGEIGTALVIGITIAPQMAESAVRINRARKLRGDDGRGIRGFLRILMPVFQDTLDRSLALAASMDARGYGRRTHAPKLQRQITFAFAGLGLMGAAIGLYVILDASAPMYVAVPIVVTGLGFLVISMVVAGLRNQATSYTKISWGTGEWLTVTSGLVPLLAAAVELQRDPTSMVTSWMPLQMPDHIPYLLVLGLMVATFPGFFTPRLPRNSQRPTRRRTHALATGLTVEPASTAVSSPTTRPRRARLRRATSFDSE